MGDEFGRGATKTTYENEYMVSNRAAGYFASVQLDGTARDAGNSIVTTLRKGLVLGQVTASKKFKEYDDGDVDGTEVARAILDETTKIIDDDGANRDVVVRVFVAQGVVDESKLHGSDAAGKVDLLLHNVLFSGDLIP